MTVVIFLLFAVFVCGFAFSLSNTYVNRDVPPPDDDWSSDLRTWTVIDCSRKPQHNIRSQDGHCWGGNQHFLILSQPATRLFVKSVVRLEVVYI